MKYLVASGQKTGGCMIGHYVEDNALDAFSMMGLLNGEANLAMTTSTSLRDFAEWVGPNDLDFVLLDIYRPDAASMESDVKKVRAASIAPIIFVTGDDAKYYREDAVLAGAQAVIEKNGLTITSLKDVLRNVTNPKPRHLMPGAAESLIDVSVDPSKEPVNPRKVGVAFDYLDLVQRGLADSDADEETMKACLSLLASASKGLQLYFRNDEIASSSGSESIPSLIRSTQESALAAAAKRSVDLVFQIGVDAFDGVQNNGQVQLGIRYLLYALLLSSDKGNSVTFAGLPARDGMRLRITSKALIELDFEQAHERILPGSSSKFERSIALTLSMLLLNVSSADISELTHSSSNVLMIDCHS
jgi:DNA-binding NarL/FixJ family response regulator